jgi:hypothetical protein
MRIREAQFPDTEATAEHPPGVTESAKLLL